MITGLIYKHKAENLSKSTTKARQEYDKLNNLDVNDWIHQGSDEVGNQGRDQERKSCDDLPDPERALFEAGKAAIDVGLEIPYTTMNPVLPLTKPTMPRLLPRNERGAELIEQINHYKELKEYIEKSWEVIENSKEYHEEVEK